VVCQALRKQFRDTRTDVDIREAFRDRKQKEGANFDSPYEAIIQMMDGLEVPLKEFTKVNILKRNWRPEIRRVTKRIHSFFGSVHVEQGRVQHRSVGVTGRCLRTG